MENRPYLRLTGNELQELFSKNSEDATILKILQNELHHREKVKMKSLLAKVDQKLGYLQASGKKTTNEPKPRVFPDQQRQKQQGAGQEDLFPDAISPSDIDGTATEKPDPILPRKSVKTQTQDSPTQKEYSDDFCPIAKGSIRRPGKLGDTPEKRRFEMKNEVHLDLDADSPLAIRYEVALKALIAEMKKKGSGSREVRLESGVAVSVDGCGYGYEFAYNDDVELFEGAMVIAIVGGGQSEGRIVAVFGNKLVISLEDDYGSYLSACIFRVDNTAMLEALRQRLEKIGKGEVSGFNSGLAERTICNDGIEQAPISWPPRLDKLNPEQHRAIEGILSNEVFYLWGPPGTGKTKTLSSLCLELLDNNKRILICSNTNQAVDQVLLSLCKLSEMQPILADGHIIRVGKIQHAELEKNWSEYVTVEGIVDRKSADLKAEKDKLERDLEKINRSTSHAQKILNDFLALDGFLANKESLGRSYTIADQDFAAFLEKKHLIVKQIADLESEKSRYEPAGTLRRLMMRKPEIIDKDIQLKKANLADINLKYIASENARNRLASQIAEVNTLIQSAQRVLSSYDRKAIEIEIKTAEQERNLLLQKIAEVNRQLDDIKKSIIQQARIIGATVTKLYLSPQFFENFDIVIVDEASMVMLPAFFNAAGLAKEKIVISGDPRQLSAIVQTDQKAIFDEVGKDVFASSNINEQNHKRVRMLIEQYRMNDNICQLVSPSYPNHGLRTSLTRKTPFYTKPPEPFNQPLIIIDTSPVYPFVNRDFFNSRFNLLNALAVRNLCKHFADNGILHNENSSIGICTPYAAQANVLRKVIASAQFEDSQVTARTVHRYQGDEKLMMVLDIPDSYGEYRAGIFLDADHPDDSGGRLFNVAVSRAKEHFIVVANLAYLDKKLPDYAILRRILSEIQEKGIVLDVRDVLAMYPIVDELKQLGIPIPLSPEAVRSGLFNQQDFNICCLADIREARNSILIFSGFVTPQRVASYEALFRSKIAEGVAIRCVTRPPNKNGSIPEDQGKEALDGLERMGCIVDTRGDIHEKFVIIDDRIIWFGSLNPLSNTSRTTEVMSRMDGNEIALQLVAFVSISKGGAIGFRGRQLLLR